MSGKTVWVAGGLAVAIGAVAYLSYHEGPAGKDAAGTIVAAKRAYVDGTSGGSGSSQTGSQNGGDASGNGGSSNGNPTAGGDANHGGDTNHGGAADTNHGSGDTMH